MPAIAQSNENLPTGPLATPARASDGRIFLAALALAVAVLAAYQNIFNAPFIFDDQTAIQENPSITQLWPPWTALMPSLDHPGATLGRPLVNYSFALNYAVSGYEVWSYHVLNLLIHGLAAWVLLGVVRRTLLQPMLAKRFGSDALPLAFLIALLWAVHPLLTETVAGVVQRAESLGALFYLLTLYCFIRSLDSRWPNAWRAGTVVAVLLGLASKETVATAPVLVFLYDRTFAAGSLAGAWHARSKFYATLAGTWLLLAGLMWSAQQRASTVGFGLGVAWWQYALKQCSAIPHYLSLVLWPHPLAIDYGNDVVTSLAAGWLPAAGLGLLLVATGWALVCRPRLGFIGAWVFIILAPSSSIVPLTTQTEAEHRMYLPLAALVALAVLALYGWVGRRAFAGLAVLALVWIVLTFQRNQDYATALSIWQNDVASVPGNFRAHQNLGTFLGALGRKPESIQEFALAAALDPLSADQAAAQNFALADSSQTAAARPHDERAADSTPNLIGARINYAHLLQQSGHLPEAIAEYLVALRDDPESVEVRILLGNAYIAMGQPEKAQVYFQWAVARKLALDQAHLGLGNTWTALSHWADAAKEYKVALQLDPNDYFARHSLGEVLINLGDIVAARREFMEVLREHPDFTPARNALDGLSSAATNPDASPVKN